jgi:hypothetical protein
MPSGLSGYTSTLPDEVLLNPALVRIGSANIGVTRGGPSWDGETEISSIAFDGKRSKYVRGTERISMRGGKLSGTILQIASAPQLQTFEPGASTATGGTGVTTIITPKGAGILFEDGDYIEDVRAIWALKAGNFFAIYMPVALSIGGVKVKGGDNGEGEIDFEFAAVLDMEADGALITDPGYRYELRTALP